MPNPIFNKTTQQRPGAMYEHGACINCHLFPLSSAMTRHKTDKDIIENAPHMRLRWSSQRLLRIYNIQHYECNRMTFARHRQRGARLCNIFPNILRPRSNGARRRKFSGMSDLRNVRVRSRCLYGLGEANDGLWISHRQAAPCLEMIHDLPTPFYFFFAWFFRF